MDLSVNPLLLSPRQTEECLSEHDTIIVDLCDAITFRQNHIPRSVHLDYARIVRSEAPVVGLLPSETELTQVIRELGIDETSHVIAYDDEGGGKASRFLWTLAIAGHERLSLLDGGFHAWFGERLPFDKAVTQPRFSEYVVTFKNTDIIANREYILQNLTNPDIVILDTRTNEEYSAIVKRALRGGHIPHAVNFDWMNALDLSRHKRMKPADELIAALAKIGVTPDKEVITYCHSHHRSAYSFIMLRVLGFIRVRGYPGSWSDWGNHPGTPVEQ